MTTKPLPILLIPGAWMGAWIWEDTIERLADAGCAARSLTLTGLDSQASRSDTSQVRLADHVADVERAVCAIDEPMMVVGHSYSGLLAGIVADRLPDLAVHTTIVCGFYPRDGRSLLDDWGPDADARAAERRVIEQAGMIWEPPPTEGIASDPNLTSEQAAWLGARLRPHPGHTICDAATMKLPITRQTVTVIADTGDEDPRGSLPDDLVDEDLVHWDFRSVPTGHWPMLGCPELLVGHLVEVASADGRADR